MSENAQRYLAIELAAVVEWERAKGQLQALIALLGSVPSEYEREAPYRPIRPRNYELLRKEVEAFVATVEDHEWFMPDRK